MTREETEAAIICRLRQIDEIYRQYDETTPTLCMGICGEHLYAFNVKGEKLDVFVRRAL